MEIVRYMKNVMKHLAAQLRLFSILSLSLLAWTAAYGQFTPSNGNAVNGVGGDTYTDGASTTRMTNYGNKPTLNVDSAAASTQAAYIQFDLSSIPPGAIISQATLKLYVNSVTAAGNFEVESVTGTWTENTLNYDSALALSLAPITASPSLNTSDANQYILIPLTATVQGWITNPSSNNGIALVANGTFNGTFDSKENTTASHAPELDIVFGDVTGVTVGSGLTGGGTSGAVNVSLTNGCAPNQVLEWNGSSWSCSSVSMGTITGVTAGAGLTGGGTGGNITLGVTPGLFATLGANAFAGDQTVSGSVTANSSGNAINGNGNSSGGTGVNGSGYIGVSGTGTFDGLSGSGSNDGLLASGGVRGVEAFGTGSGSMGVWGTGSSYGLYGTSTNYGVQGYGSYTGVYGNGYVGLYGDGGSFGVYGGAGSAYSVFAQGNLGASGTKTAVVALPDDRVVSLYAMESPENWFEDFGSSKLENGVATIALDATFAQTINPETEYHVFITPNGDCEGLYVAQKTPAGFEVRELHAGKSSVAFDYRIIAKRKGLETLRLEDVQADRETAEAIREQIAARPSHTPKLVLPKTPAPQEALAPSKPPVMPK